VKEKIEALTHQYCEEIVSWRRHLHTYPELSGQEAETAKFVAQKLREWGLQVSTDVGGHGVVALLYGTEPKKRCVALRAEIDALPIEEANRTLYVSKNKGVMHACGHDVHTANLLGTAKVLSELKEFLVGSVKFIFQPSEEKLPSGARAMIEDGVLVNPKPAAMLAFHVSPELEVGKIGFHSGEFMASSDEVYLKVIGKGGHAAQLNQTINPLYVAAEILLKLRTLSNSELSTVLNFGNIEGKGATNIVPDTVEIAGTLRCFDETQRKELHEKIRLSAAIIATQHSAACQVTIVEGHPVLINDVSLTDATRELIGHAIGSENCVDVPKRMGSEDFAYYSHMVPSCLLRLGVGNASKGIVSPIHTPTFDVDEEVFKTSVTAMALWALKI
jgi:amidohydrolase